MTLNINDLSQLNALDIHKLDNERFQAIVEKLLAVQQADRRENQLLFFKPTSEKAREIFATDASVIGVGGGNGSGKTENCLVRILALATGIIPESVWDELRPKFRGPTNNRIVIESLKLTLHPVILPKLQWWKWTGEQPMGGDKGHWGWIPKTCLIGGSWQKSWSEKLGVLRVICRDPDNPDKVLGESVLQFNSHDQDPSDFASGDFHNVLHDEPPSKAIWTENEARTMRVSGTKMLSMTWPDEPGIPVDWIFDKIYDPAMDGEPDYSWTELWSTENPHLDQESIALQMKKWSQEKINVRIYGKNLRFSNLIHPLFTKNTNTWCFVCKKACAVVGGKCSGCGFDNIEEFCHVEEFETAYGWPTVFLLDPHPRKPHMWLHAQIDPSDDIWIINDGECPGDVEETATMVQDDEARLGLKIAYRLIDPNMGRSPASAKDRSVTWQDEFDTAGLYCQLADDSDVGRSRLNEFLKPDTDMRKPRIHWHRRCTRAIGQMGRYKWDEFKYQEDHDVKQKPKEKYDDYPTLGKYLMNFDPSFRSLSGEIQTFQRKYRKMARGGHHAR